MACVYGRVERQSKRPVASLAVTVASASVPSEGKPVLVDLIERNPSTCPIVARFVESLNALTLTAGISRRRSMVQVARSQYGVRKPERARAGTQMDGLRVNRDLFQFDAQSALQVLAFNDLLP